MKKTRKTTSKKRTPWLLISAFLFIFIGVGLLLYPIAGDYFASQKRSEATSHYNDAFKKLKAKDIEQQLELAKEYNTNIFDAQQGIISPFKAVNYNKIANIQGVMGTLDIPAISIKSMPFYHGTDFKTLDEGLGHFKPTSIPIGGKNTRSVIAGHSGLENQVLFTNVKNLQVGDVFYIHILGKNLAYKIESFNEVLPSQADEVKIEPGKDMVTLLTCTPPGVNTYRLLVNGVRVPYKEALATKTIHRDTFSYTKVVIGSLIFALILFIILLILYRYFLKRFRNDDPVIKEKGRKALLRLFFATKALFILLIVIMIGVLGTAIYGYVQIQQQKEMQTVQVGKQGELSDYNLSKIQNAQYSEKDIASVTTSSFATAKLNFSQAVNDYGIGKIAIPSVGINLPILAGMNNENLMNGASTYTNSQSLGKGNYVLLAHNIPNSEGVSSPVLFGKINKLSRGQLIYASDFKNIYVYSVDTNKVVNQKDVGVIEQPKDNTATPIITLVRCEGTIGTEYRRVVSGHLIQTQSIESSKEENLKMLGVENTGSVLKDGKLSSKNEYAPYQSFAMKVSNMIVSDPVQTIVPIFLLLIIPILFLNLIG